jgi:hypothetical protein
MVTRSIPEVLQWSSILGQRLDAIAMIGGLIGLRRRSTFFNPIFPIATSCPCQSCQFILLRTVPYLPDAIWVTIERLGLPTPKVCRKISERLNAAQMH